MPSPLPRHAQVKGKKVQVDWSTNLGEHAQYIFNARVMRSLSSDGASEIVIVGERHLSFLHEETGEFKMQKRIEE